jgi:hypothetical protein
LFLLVGQLGASGECVDVGFILIGIRLFFIVLFCNDDSLFVICIYTSSSFCNAIAFCFAIAFECLNHNFCHHFKGGIAIIGKLETQSPLVLSNRYRQQGGKHI